jgi:hypothetical protein
MTLPAGEKVALVQVPPKILSIDLSVMLRTPMDPAGEKVALVQVPPKILSIDLSVMLRTPMDRLSAGRCIPAMA